MGLLPTFVRRLTPHAALVGGAVSLSGEIEGLDGHEPRRRLLEAERHQARPARVTPQARRDLAHHRELVLVAGQGTPGKLPREQQEPQEHAFLLNGEPVEHR
jgi:hypothetical protein